jgi:AraC-like DNA-binding protein
MSYDPTLLYERIFLSLQQNPRFSLEELSQELHISRRTIQNTVIAVTGKKFRDLREELLLARFKSALAAEPAAAIKELSSGSGYRSARSFARAIRRACGISPEQLRSLLAGLVASKT